MTAAAPVRGGWLSLPGKLALLAVAVFLVEISVLLPIADATRGDPLAVRVALFGVPLAIPVVIVYVLTRYIVRRTTVPLVAAYRRLAAGDFGAELPFVTAGADFATVRAAFAGMTTALDRSIAQLRDADLERRRLFADLAHELATPTSTLLGIAHALRGGTGDPAVLLDHLAHETARLERLIADVREVAHVEDPALQMLFEPCDVGALATRAVERARLAAPGVAISCDAAAAPASLDPLRIDQVLANLLANAVRHAGTGAGTAAPAVAVTVRRSDRIILRIEDSGAGVPDDQLPQLGRRMLRLDPSRSRDTGGHGLGLAIARGIVARHRGEIAFARAALGGLAVEVRLPDK